MSPFQVVYEYAPPQWVVDNVQSIMATLEECLKQRDQVMRVLKDNLTKAQSRMKFSVDRHKTKRELAVSDQVYLKSQPIDRQFAKVYGPFTILERIGVVAYRLHLPSEPNIYPVFNISMIKKRKAVISFQV